jgi:hypothetical protein
MRARSKLSRVGLAGGAILLTTLGWYRVGAVESDSNPYQVIMERNVFRLIPPPCPSAPAPASEPADLPVVAFCGTMATGDQVRALLVVATTESTGNETKSIKGAKTTSYLNLAAGQMDGLIQLARIYPDRQTIDVIISGMRKTLTMKDDGIAKIALGGPASPRRIVAQPSPRTHGADTPSQRLKEMRGADGSAGGSPSPLIAAASANRGGNPSESSAPAESYGNAIVTGNDGGYRTTLDAGGNPSQANGVQGNPALQANASFGVLVSGATSPDNSSITPNQDPSSSQAPVASKHHWPRTIPWLIDVTAQPDNQDDTSDGSGPGP